MSNSRRLKTYFGIIFVIVCVLVLPWNKVAKAAEDGQYKMIDGLAVYLGVVLAEIVKGHPSGHAETTIQGGRSKGRHEYYVVAAIFDAATGARVSGATVTAQISGLGLSGTQRSSRRWRSQTQPVTVGSSTCLAPISIPSG